MAANVQLVANAADSGSSMSTTHPGTLSEPITRCLDCDHCSWTFYHRPQHSQSQTLVHWGAGNCCGALGAGSCLSSYIRLYLSRPYQCEWGEYPLTPTLLVGECLED